MIISYVKWRLARCFVNKLQTNDVKNVAEGKKINYSVHDFSVATSLTKCQFI